MLRCDSTGTEVDETLLPSSHHTQESRQALLGYRLAISGLERVASAFSELQDTPAGSGAIADQNVQHELNLRDSVTRQEMRRMKLLTVGSIPPDWGGPSSGGLANVHRSLLAEFETNDSVDIVGVIPTKIDQYAQLSRHLPIVECPTEDSHQRSSIS